MKNYFQNMNEITADELLKGMLAHGLFAEKLPDFLSSGSFYQYYIDNAKPLFEKTGHDYIRYDSMRDINIPRPLSIPNPFAYANLCRVLSENWDKITEHFLNQTNTESHKVSRIHIRKMKKSNCLFEMNYKNSDKDGVPEQSLVIKSKYIVEADISNCFPSMYSHSIPWALVGKDIAKEKKDDKAEWFNIIDFYLRNIKNEETNGFLIGPHTSNIFSEIILTVIDKKLWNKGYRYIRNIDDYTCYIGTREKAESFLLDLSSELKLFELSINTKKVKITSLPLPTNTNWVNCLNCFYIGDKRSKDKTIIQYQGKTYSNDNKLVFELKRLKSFLDLSLNLALKEEKFSVLNYAMKIVAKTFLGKKAQKYYLDRIHHLLLSYPYLVSLMEEYVFSTFQVKTVKIKEVAQDLYDIGINKKLYEACSFTIYWSIIYNFDIERNITENSINSNDCIFMLISFLQRKKAKDKEAIKLFKNKAKNLRDNDMDRFWLFVYETLSKSDLSGEFKAIKNKNISFVKPQFI